MEANHRHSPLGVNARLLLPIILLLAFIVQVIVIFSFSGTRDSGDSIQHYLIAHHAFEHPDLLFDHWGKPLFTLLASIPASFGFTGIKFFNCLMVLWSLTNVFLISRKLFPQNHWMPLLILAFMPGLMRLQFSGLTEPLFAAWLSASVLLVLRGKVSWGFVLASFLPFIRTEGFLMLPVFALFLLDSWQSRNGVKSLLDRKVMVRMIGTLSLLTVGTLVYSLVGGIIKGDVTWVFTENPYEHLENYGQGNWGHFPKKFIFITGVPSYALWAIGMVLGLLTLFWKRAGTFSKPTPASSDSNSSGPTYDSNSTSGSAPENRSFPIHSCWRLIYGLFIVYFGAHVVFWATGIAHSMGLMRVMISLTPLAALIAARGLHFLISWFPKPLFRNVFLALVCAYITIFPFLPNPASLKVSDFELSPDQVMLNENADLYQELEANDLRVYYAHPYVPVAFGFDPFLHPRYMNNLKERTFPKGTMIVWDSWFSVKEAGVPEVFWEESADKFVLKEESQATDPDGKEIKIKFYLAR